MVEECPKGRKTSNKNQSEAESQDKGKSNYEEESQEKEEVVQKFRISSKVHSPFLCEVRVKYWDRDRWRSLLTTCHPKGETQAVEELKKRAYHLSLKPEEKKRRRKKR